MLRERENEVISKFKEIKKQLTDTESNDNIEKPVKPIYIPKRKNKKTIIDPVDTSKIDLELYKKLVEKEQKRKQQAAEYQQDGEKREKHLAYLREYAKKNRDPAKEKEYYEKNKEHVAVKSKFNMRKYMAFYKMYKDKHPEFIKDWDEKKGLEKGSE
jgi:hypothetical protein